MVTTGPEKSPGDPEGNPDDDLNGSMKDELSERGVPAERDPKEDPDPEAAEGGYVIRGAGGDDESGDPLGDVINSILEWQKNGKNSKIVRKIPKLCEKVEEKRGLKWF